MNALLKLLVAAILFSVQIAMSQEPSSVVNVPPSKKYTQPKL